MSIIFVPHQKKIKIATISFVILIFLGIGVYTTDLLFFKETRVFNNSKSDIASLKNFIKEYPDSKYITQAKILIHDKTYSKMSQDVESLKSFIEKYPDSRHIDEAKILLDDKIYEKMGSNIESLKSFIEKYPDSRHIDEAKARYKKAVDKNISIAGLHMVYVLGGCYQMGDIFGDGGEDDEKPVHEVCIDDFYIGKYEVTQGQWEKIMGYNPSFFDDGDRYPVENVSWNGVQGFIEELNSQSGKNFRLPTEAEWEYAARSGGKRQKYAGGNNVDAVAWYDDNSGDRPHPVGQKEPNDLGIYDMSGNVWEWVSDWYEDDYYAQSPRNNPTGPSSSSYSLRVLRGGDYSIHFEQAEVVRSTSRSAGDPYDKYMFHGFRLALPAK